MRSSAAITCAALALGLGCSDKKKESAQARAGAGSAQVADDASVTRGSADAAAPSHLDHARQLVVAVGADWNTPNVELARYEREDDGTWQQVGDRWPATIGRAGMGWGRGIAGDEEASAGSVNKVEGDGRTPAGVFAIGSAFGYGKEAPEGTALPYQMLTDSWRCVDDGESEYYNRVFDADGIEASWKSAEVMRRDDELYRHVILIDHNDGLGTLEAPVTPVPRAGSCIFFHVWRQPGAPTVGCVAMDRARIEELMRWLSPADKPVVAILPREAYNDRLEQWRLPALGD